MRINKFISYILCKKSIIVNLHKLHFPSFPFFSSTKQKSFLSSYFFTPPTKHIRGKTTIFSILPQFFILPLFHSSIQTECKAQWHSPLYHIWAILTSQESNVLYKELQIHHMYSLWNFLSVFFVTVYFTFYSVCVSGNNLFYFFSVLKYICIKK